MWAFDLDYLGSSADEGEGMIIFVSTLNKDMYIATELDIIADLQCKNII